MSKYTTYYNERQQMFREFAANWARATEHLDLTDLQRVGMALFFRPFARRFGLVKEFKRLGVL